MGNIYKMISGQIWKEKCRSKYKFFQKRPVDCYIQNQIFNYIGNEDNRSFFTELKQTYEKERYANLKNFEIQNALSKLRLSSNKLTVVPGKWYSIKKENRLRSFCNVNAIQDEFHFLIDCPNYKKLRKSALKSIQHTEHIDVTRGNITKKFREPLSNRSLHSLFVLGKFVKISHFERKKTIIPYLLWFLLIFYLFALSCYRFLFVYLFIHSFIYLFIYLFIHLFIYLFEI